MLALHAETSGQRLLNWERTLRQPGRYPLAGALQFLDYDRRETTADGGHAESVEVKRSLGEPLGVYLLYTSGWFQARSMHVYS